MHLTRRAHLLALSLGLLLMSKAAPAMDVGFVEVAYRGDDAGGEPAPHQYRNPIIAGFHPDPSVVRVGADFYLVTSTFGYFPGLPIFHSRDLVTWRQIGNAIDRHDQIDYGAGEELTRGLFAATLSHHAGTFYIANTCFYCDGGNFIVTAHNPAGPWSDPIWLGFTGIDPSLFFDHDGRAWVVNNDVPAGKMRYDGHRAIWLQQFDVAKRRMIGPRSVLIDGGADPASRPEHVEGPHLFRRGDWYYLTAAEGGTGEQHAQMVWRSRTVEGPYEAFPGNPTLTQRDLDPTRPEPVTSTGHAQFVELADGRWWAVFLATRPYRGNQYNLGRETFLLPVRWEDEWPVILRRGERVPMLVDRPVVEAPAVAAAPTTGPMRWRERFGADRLPPSWLSFHPPQQAWYSTGARGLALRPSTVALGAFAAVDGQPSYLGHRLQHHRATLTATLAPRPPEQDDLAALALVQNETHHYVLGVERDAEGLAVVLYRRAGRDDPAQGVRLERAPIKDIDASITLQFELDAPRLDAYYALGSHARVALARDLDASLLSADRAGGFIGNTFGPYALRRSAASDAADAE